MKNLRFKRVMRFDGTRKMLRLFRIMWERGTVGDGAGYSVKVAVSLRPSLFEMVRDAEREIRLTVAGVRVHYARSYGGTFV